MPGEKKRLMTAEDLADELGTTKWRIYDLSRRGQFNSFLVIVGTRQYRYLRDGFERYLAVGGNRLIQDAEPMPESQNSAA